MFHFMATKYITKIIVGNSTCKAYFLTECQIQAQIKFISGLETFILPAKQRAVIAEC